ncbi:glutamate--tRNA ligase [bacterium]|nr:glutamate--tRNA ligase [bacterium]
MKEVRTRFAPSPTGLLHIGGFRSALYAWLLARHHGGKFLLRIEDTDQERRVPGAIQYILDGFRWFGMEIDEGPTEQQIQALDGEQIAPNLSGEKGEGGPYGPYVQSLRLTRYQEIAEQLIEAGVAFRCDCTPEMLQEERLAQQARKEVPGYSGYCRTRNVSRDTKHVVRFKMPDKAKVVMQDGIRGRIEWEKIPLRDPVLLKSDGFPTYHLAVVVDDHDMEISHVMRGEEWIPSAPLHLMLYDALGWERPTFCHLPVVLGSDGKKLSKRHGSTSWSSFQDEGYLPEALLNFIARIGWSPGEGDEQEIFSREELIEKFSLDHVNASSGVFEYTKLSWMNGVYLRQLSPKRFFEESERFLAAEGLSFSFEELEPLLPLIQERVKLLTEVPALLTFLSEDHFTREIDQIVTKKVSAAKAGGILAQVYEKFGEIEELRADSIEPHLVAVAEALGVKSGAVLLTTRIAVLGKKATPPLFESLELLGKERVRSRLEEAIPLVQALEREAAVG